MQVYLSITLSSLFYKGSIEVMDNHLWMYKIHHKDYRGWIIVMGFRVFLISQHLLWEILVEAVLGVHAEGIKIKSFFIHIL